MNQGLGATVGDAVGGVGNTVGGPLGDVVGGVGRVSLDLSFVRLLLTTR